MLSGRLRLESAGIPAASTLPPQKLQCAFSSLDWGWASAQDQQESEGEEEEEDLLGAWTCFCPEERAPYSCSS